MWAPADLFSRTADMMILPMRHGVTFVYERPLVLGLLLLAVASVIALVEAVKGHRPR